MSLAADQLEVRYGQTLAVAATSVALAPGELIGLIGPNGAGKTSLLRALAGIPVADHRVRWMDRPLPALGAAVRARAIAYLPQVPAARWPLSVGELVALGRIPHRRFAERLTAADHEAIARAMDKTDVSALADRSVDRLSGGERMRVHLARAFAVEAPALLVDEPVASLDPYHQLNVMRLLAEQRDSGCLVVAVLHDLNLALRFCSRLLLMDGGRIVVDDVPERALDTEVLARHYRIRAWLTRHEGRRVAVPWDRLDADG